MATANIHAVTTPANDYERIPCQVYARAHEAANAVAHHIAGLIRQRASEGRSCVLGLATGSTPVGVYDELVRMHQHEGLSFKNVITFNLDEYYPMQPNELQSYVRFMNEHLFDHVDILPENVHVPDGTLDESEVHAYCREYEGKIHASGGIDVQLLGIGRTGHVGFNEPGSGIKSRTRLITLDRVTRLDAASDFFGEEHVPRRAITMGVGTIMDAHEIILLAFGEHKAPIVAQAVEGEITSSVAASYLQQHGNAKIILDAAAAESLTRRRCPWRVGKVDWTSEKIRKAVIWLARDRDKSLLKLTPEDYNEAGLQDLLADHGPAYEINLAVFRHLHSTISGWPGGKPDHAKLPGDRSRPHDAIFPKRVLIFSPHPDDDVISMGGTLICLADQGHEVHVAYQTSGNIAVFDDDAIRFCEFVADFNRAFDVEPERTNELEAHVEEFLKNKQAGQVDSQEVQAIKGLIRRGEARAATRYCGIPENRLHFLDMPFYETGRVKKKPLSDADIDMIVNLYREIQPHQIYAAGDLSDPHGTHRTCLRAVVTACDRVLEEEWYQRCEVWLYRGAWHEWEPHEIEMAVPLSPQEVLRKRVAIFKHESQKDRALFPGPDMREFWKRAEDRNADTARLYDALGLAEYEAIEGFVRWHGDSSTV
ncbi:MAG: glucosamine-6-phosphate deaminase [Planctomycetales bacterium]|nr:glucosamine-6-phosphate deaminase [Planctomycetales bacterium]